MDAPHPFNLIVKKLPEVTIPGHNLQPKLKTQAGFVINSVTLCPSIYLYHDKVRIDYLME